MVWRQVGMVEVPISLSNKTRPRHNGLRPAIGRRGEGDNFIQGRPVKAIHDDRPGRLNGVALAPGAEGQAPGDLRRPGHGRCIKGAVQRVQSRHSDENPIRLFGDGQETEVKTLPFIGPGVKTRLALRLGPHAPQPIGDPRIGHHRGERIKIILAKAPKDQTLGLDHAGRAVVSAP